MGLLDLQDPQTAGILAAASGLLGASGPSRMPVSLGQAIGGGMNQGMGAYRQAANDQMARTHLQSQMAIEKERADMLKQQMLMAQKKMQQDEMRQAQMGAFFGLPGAQSQPAAMPSLPGGQAVPMPQMAGGNAVSMPQPPQGNNPLASLDPETRQVVQAMAASGDFGGAMKAMQDALKPHVTSDGRAVQFRGGGVQAVPGSVDTFSNFQTAAERAKAAFDTAPGVVDSQNRPIPMTREVFAQRYGKQPAQAQNLPPETLAAIQADMAKRGITNANFDINGVKGTLGPQGMGMTAAEQEAAKQRAQITPEAIKGLNEDWIKRVYPAVTSAGESASGLIANLDALKNINMKTGWGTEAKAAAASVLAGLGIGGKNAEMYAANAQKFQSVAMTKLWETLNQAKGPQTEGDANRAKATFAQLSNTPEANDFIVDFARAMANRDRRKAAFYNEAMPAAREAGDLTEVDRTWQKIQGSVWDDPSLARWKR